MCVFWGTWSQWGYKWWRTTEKYMQPRERPWTFRRTTCASHWVSWNDSPSWFIFSGEPHDGACKQLGKQGTEPAWATTLTLVTEPIHEPQKLCDLLSVRASHGLLSQGKSMAPSCLSGTPSAMSVSTNLLSPGPCSLPAADVTLRCVQPAGPYHKPCSSPIHNSTPPRTSFSGSHQNTRSAESIYLYHEKMS